MTLFQLWNLPGDVLAAPESASGLDRCNLSLSQPVWWLERGVTLSLICQAGWNRCTLPLSPSSLPPPCSLEGSSTFSYFLSSSLLSSTPSLSFLPPPCHLLLLLLLSVEPFWDRAPRQALRRLRCEEERGGPWRACSMSRARRMRPLFPSP